MQDSVSININLIKEERKREAIPKGYKCTPTLVNGKKEGPVEVFTPDSVLYANLIYHEDLLDGLCEYYDRGVLIEKISYKNGKEDGWGCVFENGKETAWYFYENGQKKSIVKEIEDQYREEREIGSGNVLSVCKYTKDHEKDGIGFIYENNLLSAMVEFDKNKVSKTIKTFKGQEMTELNENGDTVYVGGYINNRKKQYPRNGEGKEYHEGNIVYDGSWKENMKEGKGTSYQNHRALYVGSWSNDLPNGEGRLYDKNGSVLYQGTWKKGLYVSKKGMVHYGIQYSNNGIKKVTTQSKKHMKELKKKMETKTGKRVTGLLIALLIGLIGFGFLYGVYVWWITDTVRTKDDLMSLRRNVRRLRIPANSCNEEDLTEVRWSDYPKLERIVVGSNSMKNVKSVMIDSLESLELLEFGMNSFTQATNSYRKDTSRGLAIMNCYKLKSVVFDRFAFSDYSLFSIESMREMRER